MTPVGHAGIIIEDESWNDWMKADVVKLKDSEAACVAAPEGPWHACSVEAAYRRLCTTPSGLTEQQASQRLQEYGPNALPGKKPPSFLGVVLHQFLNPLIYILLAAAAVSSVLGDFKDAAFILAVILVNAGIGTFQEWRAERSAHALQSLLKIQARVKRAGETVTLPAEDLVPGDLVLVESGDKVPADLRVVQANNLTADESLLTGESTPVRKNPAELPERTPVHEQANMLFAGSTVISGRGLGLVAATGARSEVGKIARSITETESAKPPLVVRMERFSRQVGLVVLAFAVVLGAISVGRGMPIMDVFFVMVAMAVSAIPEGLPVGMTVALSIATARMTRRGVIARKLVAVESLGSCTTIASDKTGTLTVNQQTVKLIVFPEGIRVEVGGQGYNDEGRPGLPGGGEPDERTLLRLQEVARAGIISNEGTLVKKPEGWRFTGDSMDVALLALGYKLGVDPDDERSRSRVVAEIPFESEKRYSAAAFRSPGGVRAVVKGALEVVAPFCAAMRTSEGDKPLDMELLAMRTRELAEGGYRVLAVAEGPLSEEPAPGTLEASALRGLTLLALVGFIDPLRPEVKDAVSRARRAGIKVVMITGDHPGTALAIAKELEIADSDEQVLTGHDMNAAFAYDTPEFHERLRKVRVFARVTPEQKLMIVEGLMEIGEFVAVTGDGVNDAPALNRANIGVAMGSGTDVAKDAAQIIITDDNFASIVNGVEEGRYAYANVRKVTLFLISTGFAELLLISAAMLVGLPLPFLAVQLLWLNLVTNGIQDVALAFEAGEKELMEFPPRRPSEGLFNRRMIEQVLLGGGTMAAVCLGAWALLLRSGRPEPEARNLLLSLMVVMQFFHVLNCRSEYRSVFKVSIRDNRVLAAGMAAAFAVHLAAGLWPPTNSLLRVAPIPAVSWAAMAGVGAVLLVVMELYKRLRLPTKGAAGAAIASGRGG